MHRKSYPTDVTDNQWVRISEILGLDRIEPKRGRPNEIDTRELVNAIAYRWNTGISWRRLPHDFPAWASVYRHFKRWRAEGLIPAIRAALLENETVVERIEPKRAAV